MGKLLNQFKLSTRIMLLGVTIILCFSMIFMWLYPKLKTSMYGEKELKTRHLVESAWSIVEFYKNEADKGKYSVDEAKQMALNTVQAMRYEGNEYFWINDMSHKMIMHPMDPSLNGKDQSTKTDPNGKRMFVEMVNVCRTNGQGIVDYYWPKPGEPKPMPKISYVKLMPEWDWIVGSGIYVDDVEKAIAAIFMKIFGAAILVIVISITLSFFMSKSISLPINRFAGSLDQGAEQVASASSQVSATSQSLAEGGRGTGRCNRGNIFLPGRDVFHDKTKCRSCQPGGYVDEKNRGSHWACKFKNGGTHKLNERYFTSK